MCFKNDWMITEQSTEYGGKNNCFFTALAWRMQLLGRERNSTENIGSRPLCVSHSFYQLL